MRKLQNSKSFASCSGQCTFIPNISLMGCLHSSFWQAPIFFIFIFIFQHSEYLKFTTTDTTHIYFLWFVFSTQLVTPSVCNSACTFSLLSYWSTQIHLLCVCSLCLLWRGGREESSVLSKCSLLALMTPVISATFHFSFSVVCIFARHKDSPQNCPFSKLCNKALSLLAVL